MSEITVRKSVIVTGALCALLASNPTIAQMDGDHSGPVMNYHRVNDRLVTGGHIVGDGMAELSAQGVTLVIDVRDNSPSGEKKRYAEQGIEWINVPIEWRDPKKADFERFREVMDENKDAHVLVQCAANFRASAMTYLYRVVVEDVPEDEAKKDLNAVWDPDENDTWREYIGEIVSADPTP